MVKPNEKFVVDYDPFTWAQCNECANYMGDAKCRAFPTRIPDKILSGDFDHRRPYPGDNGVRFTPVETET